MAALGNLELKLGHYQQAASHLQEALATFQATGHRVGQARALTILADIERQEGRNQQAASHLQQAAALFSQINDQPAAAEILNSLNEILEAAGQPSNAHPAAGQDPLTLISQVQPQTRP
jgi:tetratricopeptide (TPR) repeat protein